MSNIRLKQNWFDLTRRADLNCNPKETFKELVSRYNEEGRHYHTLSHIQKCLSFSGQVKDLLDKPDQVDLAIWFHDFVYDVRQVNNEEASAKVAESFCRKAGKQKIAEPVYHLIMATKHSSKKTDDNDTKFFLDIDLAILGSPATEFFRYEQHIRKEYQHVPLNVFNQARADILNQLLRNGVYHTEYFTTLLAEQAEINIRNSLRKLKF